MLVPSPDLVLIFFKDVDEFVFNGVGGVLTDNFISILVK